MYLSSLVPLSVLPVCLLPRSLSRFLAPGLWQLPGQCPGSPSTTMSPNLPRIFLQSTSSSCLGGSMAPFHTVLSLRAPSVSSCLLPRPVGMGSGLLSGVCAAPEKALQPLPHSSSVYNLQDRPLLPSSPTVNPSEAFHRPRKQPDFLTSTCSPVGSRLGMQLGDAA